MRSSVSDDSRAARSLFHLKNVERGGPPSRTRSSSAPRCQADVILKKAVRAAPPNSSGSNPALSTLRGWNMDLSSNGVIGNLLHLWTKRQSQGVVPEVVPRSATVSVFMSAAYLPRSTPIL